MTIADKLTLIAENEPLVYEGGRKKGYLEGKADGTQEGYNTGYSKGYETGNQEGYDKGYREGSMSAMEDSFNAGFEVGKQDEYNTFWDYFQDRGTRNSYVSAFSNNYWSGAAYNPKYPFTPTAANGCYSMFAWNTKITDIKMSITLCDDLTNMFNWCSKLTRIPELVWNDTVTKVTQMFDNCPLLEELNCKGVISIGGINLQSSTKLTKASIESVINCLSSDTTGLSITLSQTAVNNAFTSAEWETLKASKPNWVIDLA